jgi:hypothetical protein
MAVKKNQFQLAKYRMEAVKTPFDLIIDEKTSVIIPPPSTDDVLAVSEASTPREQLRLLAGDQFGTLMEHIGDEPGGILRPLLNDLTGHFKLGE